METKINIYLNESEQKANEKIEVMKRAIQKGKFDIEIEKAKGEYGYSAILKAKEPAEFFWFGKYLQLIEY